MTEKRPVILSNQNPLTYLFRTVLNCFSLETCGLLWCFYQLFGLSFWRHPFISEDPLVSKWCNATFLKICSDEETNSLTSRMAWGRVHFQQSIICGWTIPLRWFIRSHLYKRCALVYKRLILNTKHILMHSHWDVPYHHVPLSKTLNPDCSRGTVPVIKTCCSHLGQKSNYHTTNN